MSSVLARLREYGREYQTYHFVLPYDDLANFLAQAMVCGGEGISCLFVVSV
jgi:hypothetical protein